MACLLTISIYLWHYDKPVTYEVRVKECNEEVVRQWVNVYRPNRGYKAIKSKCVESESYEY